MKGLSNERHVNDLICMTQYLASAKRNSCIYTSVGRLPMGGLASDILIAASVEKFVQENIDRFDD